MQWFEGGITVSILDHSVAALYHMYIFVELRSELRAPSKTVAMFWTRSPSVCARDFLLTDSLDVGWCGSALVASSPCTATCSKNRCTVSTNTAFVQYLQILRPLKSLSAVSDESRMLQKHVVAHSGRMHSQYAVWCVMYM